MGASADVAGVEFAPTLWRIRHVVMVLLVAFTYGACGGESEEAGSGAAPSTAPSTTVLATTTVPTTVATTVPATTPTTLSRNAPPARVDFADAVSRGILSAEVRGNSLTNVQLAVTSSAAENLLVTIAPATFFESQSAGVQNMVSTGSQEFRISPGQRISQSVNAACANMRLDTPAAANTFAVSGQHSAEMAALLGVPSFNREPFRIKQFAVWTISDNPSRNGFTGLTGTGGSGPPTDAEIARIQELFRAAGLDPAQWRALR